MRCSGRTAAGVRRFVGVLDRCGYALHATVESPSLREPIARLGRRGIPAPRGDLALGIATGAALAGLKTAAWMDSAALRESVDVLASVNLPRAVPVLLVLGGSCREAFPTELLRLLRIPYWDLGAGGPEEPTREADVVLGRFRRPVAVLLRGAEEAGR